MDENFGKNCWNFAEILCFSEGQYKKEKKYQREEILEKIGENRLRHQNITKKKMWIFWASDLSNKKGKFWLLQVWGSNLKPVRPTCSPVTTGLTCLLIYDVH